ncbi:MAG: LemA family protein [Bacilli bacterium]|nr:LemA family protein [Bacilli bacterium]MBQ8901541.1 LemA family protein [Bacilli bacterium]
MNWWIILIIVVVLLVLYVISVYNSLVNLKNKVEDQASQIDVELKRRFDLVPNLVETVKGYTKHEKETLENVVKARNSYVSADNLGDQLKADGELTNAISKLFALTESYPDLKANENFMNLQNELSAIEEKIVYARQFYNDSVLMLNNKVEMFPSNLVAKMFNFTKKEFFEASSAERENVKVKF